jgi:outer membrane protein assembly factor BamB
LWQANAGGGPPIVAAGLVWTVGKNGVLYGLDESTGAVRQQVSIGSVDNDFTTPSVGDGLLLVASSNRVVAFRGRPNG